MSKSLFEQVHKHNEVAQSHIASLRMSWPQILAVGNGGGALLIGGALKEAKGFVWFALLPAAWMFVAGLLVAGVAHLVLMAGARSRADGWWAMSNALLQRPLGEGAEDVELSDDEGREIREAFEANQKLHTWRTWCEAISALLFAVGVCWPLFAFTTQHFWEA